MFDSVMAQYLEINVQYVFIILYFTLIGYETWEEHALLKS